MAKRVRSVFETDQIPHKWAHGLEPGQKIRNAGGNLYAEGDTIYSYGSHFPIARRLTLPGTVTVGTFNPARGRRKSSDIPGIVTVYLYTTARFSVTTRGHCYGVERAIRNLGAVFHIDPTDAAGRSLWDPLTNRKGSARPVAEWYQSRIDTAEREGAAPRVRASTRVRAAERAAELLAEWRALHAAFNLRISVDTVKVTGSPDAIRAKYADSLRKEAEAAAKRDAAERAARAAADERRRLRDERKAANLPAVIADWRAGGPGRVEVGEGATRDIVTIRDVSYPVLRIEGEEVVTSHGARVPVADGKQTLTLLPRLLARMERQGPPVRDDSATVGGFRGVGADLAALRIGCHTIPWAEVSAFCAAAGWDCPPLPIGEPVPV